MGFPTIYHSCVDQCVQGYAYIIVISVLFYNYYHKVNLCKPANCEGWLLQTGTGQTRLDLGV